jgi:hypothetical protein
METMLTGVDFQYRFGLPLYKSNYSGLTLKLKVYQKESSDAGPRSR